MAINGDDKIARTVGTQVLIFGLVFGMAASVRRQSIEKHVDNVSALIIGYGLQFIILPLLGFLLVKAIELEFASGITLIILMTSPGGAFSNWCSSLFNSDLALSITMTMYSTLLGVLMVPCNVVMYSSWLFPDDDVLSYIDWLHLFLTITVVLVAGALGLYFSIRSDSFAFNLFANRIGNISGISLLVFIVMVMIYGDNNVDIHFAGHSWMFYYGIAVPPVISLIIATAGGTFFSLPKPECVTVAIESSCQNSAIVVTAVLAMFQGDELKEALAVPLYYALIDGIVLILYFILMWKKGWTKAPKDEYFLTVIGTPYEVWDDYNVGANHRNRSNDNNKQAVEEQFDDGVVLKETHVEHGSRRRTFLFWRKSKNLDASKDAPTISPTSTLSPEAFGYSPRSDEPSQPSQEENKKTTRSYGRRLSRAVKSLFIDESAHNDPNSVDRDLSIAGESDLESGLSVGDIDNDMNLSGFSFKERIVRGSMKAKHMFFSSVNAKQDPTSNDIKNDIKKDLETTFSTNETDSVTSADDKSPRRNHGHMEDINLNDESRSM